MEAYMSFNGIPDAYSAFNDDDKVPKIGEYERVEYFVHQETVNVIEETDWNEKYQQLVDRVSIGDADTLSKFASINDLVTKFVATAKSEGQKVISEVNLADDEKSIKRLDVGGVAGGAKFFSKGVFFKFVSDFNGMYKSDAKALKVAGAELVGLRSYSQCGIPGLHVPLMTLVDYRGYRLIASCKLPLSKNTLIYGSADAGKTVHADDSVMNEAMSEAAKQLNLKSHITGASQTVSLSAPCDIEGHKGTDGRYYVLDTARVSPPEDPIRSALLCFIPPDTDDWIQTKLIPAKNWSMELQAELNFPMTGNTRLGDALLVWDMQSQEEVNVRATTLLGKQIRGTAVVVQVLHCHHLYNLLRPELVQSNDVPLSSDAFSWFGVHNAQQNNQEVRETTQRLVNEVIPQFARDLENGVLAPRNSTQLRDLMHARGINMRYLGVLRLCINKEDNLAAPYRDLIFTEMTSRVLKDLLKEQLRSSSSPSDDAVTVALNLLNKMLGRSERSDGFWASDARVWLVMKYGWYGEVLKDEENNATFDLRGYISRTQVFESMQKMAGLSFTAACRQRLQRSTSFFVSEPFSANDFVTGQPFVPVARAIMDREDMLKNMIRNSGVLSFTSIVHPTATTTAPPHPRLRDVPLTTDRTLIEKLLSDLRSVFGEQSLVSTLGECALAFDYYRAGDMKSALALATKAQTTISSYEHVSTDLRAFVHYLCGELHLCLSQNDLAVKDFQEAVKCLSLENTQETGPVSTSQDDSAYQGSQSISQSGDDFQQRVNTVHEWRKTEFERVHSLTDTAERTTALQKLDKEFKMRLSKVKQIHNTNAFLMVVLERLVHAAIAAKQQYLVHTLAVQFLSLFNNQYLDSDNRMRYFQTDTPIALSAWAESQHSVPELYLQRAQQTSRITQTQTTHVIDWYLFFITNIEWFCGEQILKKVADSETSTQPTTSSSQLSPEALLAKCPHLAAPMCQRCHTRVCVHASHPLACYKDGVTVKTSHAMTTKMSSHASTNTSYVTSRLVSVDEEQGVVNSEYESSGQPGKWNPQTHKLHHISQLPGAVNKGTETLEIEGESVECQVWKFVYEEPSFQPGKMQQIDLTEWIVPGVALPLKMIQITTPVGEKSLGGQKYQSAVVAFREEVTVPAGSFICVRNSVQTIVSGSVIESISHTSTEVPNRAVQSQRHQEMRGMVFDTLSQLEEISNA